MATRVGKASHQPPGLTPPRGKVPALMALTALAIVPAAAGAQATFGYAETLYGRHKQTFTVEAAALAGASQFIVRKLDAGRSLVEFVPPAAPGPDGATPGWPAPTGYPTAYATHLDWTVAIRPIGWESVTVPAGTFRALKVEITGQRGKDSDLMWQVKQAGRFHYTAWFAAGSARYVKARHISWTMQDAPFGDETVELLAP